MIFTTGFLVLRQNLFKMIHAETVALSPLPMTICHMANTLVPGASPCDNIDLLVQIYKMNMNYVHSFYVSKINKNRDMLEARMLHSADAHF